MISFERGLPDLTTIDQRTDLIDIYRSYDVDSVLLNTKGQFGR